MASLDFNYYRTHVEPLFLKAREQGEGVVGSPDGRRLYVTNEAERSVDVVDMNTLDEANQVHVVKRIPLSGGPHNIAISRDGRTV